MDIQKMILTNNFMDVHKDYKESFSELPGLAQIQEQVITCGLRDCLTELMLVWMVVNGWLMERNG